MTNQEIIALHHLVTKSIKAWNTLIEMAEETGDESLKVEAGELSETINAARKLYTEAQFDAALESQDAN